MLSSFNNLSKILVIVGLSLSVFGYSIFGIEWLDIIGLSVALVGFLINKQNFIKENPEYGKQIYYSVLILFIVLVFVKWFFI